MREDMSKVVIERPRWGHSLRSSKTRLRIHRYDPEKDYEDLPKRVSGSRSKYLRVDEVKYFSDLLGPLRRFLRSNVGRPWDQVYSEMKKHLDDRKVTGRHVFEHVDREVERHPIIGDDGRFYRTGCDGRLQLIYEFYVDPRTGLLRWSDEKPPWRMRDKPTQDVNYVRLSANACYAKINGIWYFIEYKTLVENPALARTVPASRDSPILIVRKKQLSHKELKTAKLKNDHPLAGSDKKAREEFLPGLFIFNN
ncbi:MAG TPA: hypothetical protein VFY40_23985 [Blastocatellia bacterium]|nr:hypothetical protein [Blastocatellia bacterium]